MNNKNAKHAHRLLPYAVIVAASQGEPTAVRAVLRHFEGYIARLATRTLYDEYGNVYLAVDEDVKNRLETALITGILDFDDAA